MIKKRSLVLWLPLIAALAATPAFAQGYVGGSLGRSDHNMNRGDWDAGAGFSTTYDNSDSTVKVFGGYQFNKNFALEGGYANLGRYRARISGAADSGTADVKTTSLHLFAVGIVPLNERFSLAGKIGVSHNRSEMTFSSGGVSFRGSDSGSDNRTSLAFGIGAAFHFNKQVGLRLEYEDFGKAGETNNGFTTAGRTSNSRPQTWSVGVQVNF